MQSLHLTLLQWMDCVGTQARVNLSQALLTGEGDREGGHGWTLLCNPVNCQCLQHRTHLFHGLPFSMKFNLQACISWCNGLDSRRPQYLPVLTLIQLQLLVLEGLCKMSLRCYKVLCCCTRNATRTFHISRQTLFITTPTNTQTLTPMSNSSYWSLQFVLVRSIPTIRRTYLVSARRLLIN